MRPEHGETKVKTEARKCQTKTKTQKLLWDGDEQLQDRDSDQYDQLNCTWK